MTELDEVIKDTKRVFASFGEETSLADLRIALDAFFGSGVLDPDCQHLALRFGEAGGELIVPSGIQKADGAVLYLHGGGYAVCSIDSHRDLCERLAHAAHAAVLAVDYRLAPEHPFPAALDDALAGYQWLLDEGHAPASIAVAGDSAGGGLALATLLAIRDRGLPEPACGALLSPWVDLELKGDTMKTKADVDPIVEEAALRNWIQCYTPDADVTNPLISPLLADLRELQPLLIQVGENEALLDDARRLA